MLISGFHTKCRHKANQGKIDWFCQGIHMLATVSRIDAANIHAFKAEQAAHNPEPKVKQDLSQSDISEMWERLDKIEF